MMMLSNLLYLAILVGFGLFMFLLGKHLSKPPVVGTLTVDVSDWKTDRYRIDISDCPLVDLPDFKIVGLKVKSWPKDFRDTSKDFNEAD
jgi:hypothetical protein